MLVNNHIEDSILHRLPSAFLKREVSVALIGAGGTGSQVLSGLARLHRAMLGLGHPGGFSATVFDPDLVSEANVGRQLFYDADIGFYKSDVLVHRLNIAFGLNWVSESKPFTRSSNDSFDFVIGCVDTATARRDIDMACQQMRATYWLDFGNKATEGQCVLGEVKRQHHKDWYMRLPTVMELFPSLSHQDMDVDDSTPSCSLAEALERQELFINQMVATTGLNMLWQLFRHGEIGYCASFVDLSNGSTSTLSISRDAWRRFGHRGARRPRNWNEVIAAH